MAEPKITDVMQAHARDAVAYARKHFGEALDFSPASLARVDRMLGVLHGRVRPKAGWAKWVDRLLRRGLSDEQVWDLAKMWGGYVGEVIRRHQGGGSWRSSLQPGGEVRIILDVAGTRLYPADDVRRRIAAGAGDGAVLLFRRAEEAAGPPPRPRPAPPRPAGESGPDVDPGPGDPSLPLQL